MGRMSEARKRARRPGTSGVPPKGPEAAPPPSPPVRLPPAPPPRAVEPIFFPAEAVEDSRGRISLPSSGLAEDILRRADAQAVSSSPGGALAEATPAPLPAGASAPEAASRAHNISFFAAPAREERKTVEATEHLATFFLASEEYGVDVRLVQEIIRVSAITQVPRAPEFIKGVINLRGRIIPVVDLKRKLGLGEVVESRAARIVVVKVKERLVGLLVDGASQVKKVPVSRIEAAPEEVMQISANYIRGVAKLEKGLVILVDLPKILSLELREGGDAESNP